MIFRDTWEQVIDRTKTRTRRIVKIDYDHVPFPDNAEIKKVVKIKRHPCLVHRTIYEVGKTYAVQPGRGKKSVGRFRIEKIRREFLHEITVGECIKEGIKIPDWGNLGLIALFDVAVNDPTTRNDLVFYIVGEFMKLWDSLYAGTSYTFDQNPEVWVLEIECVDPFGWGNDTKSTHYFTRLPEPFNADESIARYMSKCGTSFATELERVEMPPGRGCQSCNSLIKHDRNKIRSELARKQ